MALGSVLVDKLWAHIERTRARLGKAEKNDDGSITTDSGTVIPASDVAAILAAVAEEDFTFLQGVLTPEIIKAFKDAGYSEIAHVTSFTGDRDALLNVLDEGAVSYAEERGAELVTQVTESTRDMLRGTVEDALKEGWSKEEFSQELQNNFGFSEYRADMIAHTELAFAHSYGRVGVMKEAGATKKKWLLSADHDPNEDCFCSDAADAGWVDIDENFVDDDDYDYPPGHPNCWCDWISNLNGEGEDDDGSDDTGGDSGPDSGGDVADTGDEGDAGKLHGHHASSADGRPADALHAVASDGHSEFSKESHTGRGIARVALHARACCDSAQSRITTAGEGTAPHSHDQALAGHPKPPAPDEAALSVSKYDPDQPRDDHGRFGDGGVEHVQHGGASAKLLDEGHDLRLTALRTEPQSRGKGDATALMHAVIARADAEGKRVVLHAIADRDEDEDRLHGFYSRFGFVRGEKGQLVRNPKTATKALSGLVKWNEDQPRDEAGRFGSGGNEHADALARLNAQPTHTDATTGATMIASPGPTDHAGHSQELIPRLRDKDMRRNVNIQVRSLTYQKEQLSRDAVERAIKSNPQSSIVVVRSGGKNYVIDGNHRAAAAHFRNERFISATVYNLDAKKLDKGVDVAHEDLAKYPVDDLAHDSALSPTNPEGPPSDKQKRAGNYRMGHLTVGGLPISIENPAGTARRVGWTAIQAHYGYIRLTTGADGDHLDCFVKPGTDHEWTGPVYVVDQFKLNGEFDEHKVLLGYTSKQEAIEAYLGSYQAGWKLGPVTTLSWDAFKRWVEGNELSQPVSPWRPIKGNMEKGDIPGHDFHGNQYTEGSGGEGSARELTPQEVDAVKEYTNGMYGSQVGGYVNLQTALRGGEPLASWGWDPQQGNTIVENLRSAFSASVTDKDQTAYRGVRVVRGGDTQLLDAKVGTVLHEAGVLSTSTSRDVVSSKFQNKLQPSDKLVHIELSVPKGTHAIDIGRVTGHKAEKELAIAPGSRVTITARTERNGVLRLKGVVST